MVNSITSQINSDKIWGCGSSHFKRNWDFSLLTKPCLLFTCWWLMHFIGPEIN